MPVVDHWWQTETGWAIVRQPARPRADADQARLAVGPGARLRRRRSSTRRGSACAPDVEGAICIKLPLPPGCLPTLWNDDERYVASYMSAYPGWYLTGDGGYKDADGYVYVMGRTDDVINVAGHRLSTGSMEAVLADHPAVAECAVVGVADQLKGQVPRGFVVLKAGLDVDPEAAARRAGPAGARADRRRRRAARDRRRRRRCRRPGRARSCARRCARSPTASSPAVPSTHRGRLGARRARPGAAASRLIAPPTPRPPVRQW